jgi:hypothetical protein
MAGFLVKVEIKTSESLFSNSTPPSRILGRVVPECRDVNWRQTPEVLFSVVGIFEVDRPADRFKLALVSEI